MPSLPSKSTGNSLKGLWFVFQEGQNKVHAWGSAATGKEKVFLNYQLVSERHNLKKQSAHLFQEKGAVYEVKGDLKKAGEYFEKAANVNKGVVINQENLFYAIRS